MVPRKIFTPGRKKVTRGWGKVCYKRFRHLYQSPDIIKGIKSKIIRRNDFAARMGEKNIDTVF
jgi:hypothetical protein